MSERIQPVKGTHDILPEEQGVWGRVRAAAASILPLYGYREIATPMFERAELFERSVGVATDIVEKEMYSFADSKGRRIALRPEGTAGVVRACVHHGRLRSHPLDKLYYLGPMFRRERPQKGRFRQFHQLGVEAIGEGSASLDVEVIALLSRLLTACGVDRVELQINSVGCPECRPAYRDALVSALSERQAELCGDCQRRLTTNPLRLLDCKVPTCGEITTSAPEIVDHLCDGCRDHLDTVERGLTDLGIDYTLNPRLVRGLDYYTRTAFEAIAEGLGAQAAVAAGGRYDGLVEELGGASTPAIGFAIGLERLVTLMDDGAEALPLPLFVAALGKQAHDHALKLVEAVRSGGVAVEMDHSDRSLKAQLRRADRLNARRAVILGEEELAAGEATVRDLTAHNQMRYPLADLAARLIEEERP